MVESGVTKLLMSRREICFNFSAYEKKREKKERKKARKNEEEEEEIV